MYATYKSVTVIILFIAVQYGWFSLYPDSAYMWYHANSTAPRIFARPSRPTRYCTPQERVQHLVSYCEDLFGESLSHATKSKPTKFSSTAVFYSPKEEVMWCEVSKAGCSTLQHVLGYRYRARRKTLKKSETIYEKFENYTKMTNIRHPFDRLLSAFYNAKRKKPKDARGPNVKALRHIANFSNRTSYHNLTLVDYIEFLVSPYRIHPPYIYYDRHWDPFFRSCKMCSLQLDFIVRSESMAHDMKPILPKYGYPKDYLEHMKVYNPSPRLAANSSKETDESVTSKVPAVPHYLYTKPVDDFDYSHKKILNEFKEIDQNLLHKVYNKYRHDFAAFGYHFNSVTYEATCGIVLPSGEVCC